jgi:hypothetical protein
LKLGHVAAVLSRDGPECLHVRPDAVERVQGALSLLALLARQPTDARLVTMRTLLLA